MLVRDSRLLASLAATTLLAFLVAAPAAETNLNEQYRATATSSTRHLTDSEGYAKLAYLCDRIGNRLSGSESLEKAIAWGAEQMKRDGLSNVRILPVKVPHWVRGAESGSILSPIPRPLHVLGLGGSVGTPPGGITADAVAVTSFDELDKLDR